MISDKLVSIIIPCYNQAQYLEESVKSALTQSYQNIEVIIVNDGSRDNTQETAEKLQKKHPTKIHMVNQDNMGLSEARNSGIKKASGQYIVPLDADDFLHQDMVKHSLNTMIDHNADIVYSGYELFGTINRKNYLKPFYKNIILYWNVCSATALYKKDVWQAIGGYKENMHGGYEDWEFWINAYKHGFKFQHLSEILWSYRRKNVSMVEDAKGKDSYLRAKIIMNHPELYTFEYTKKAIETIKSTEGLADLYFYYKHNNNSPIEIKQILDGVSRYLDKNILKEEQTIQVDHKNIVLVNLDILEDAMTVSDLQKNMHADFVLLYGTLRYATPNLITCDLAWHKAKGLTPVKGTIFPYIPRTLREDEQKQFTAHKRLFCYQQVLLTIERAKKINKLEESLNLLLNATKEITTYSILRHPYKKYKAYKTMLNTYYKVRKMKK